MNEKQWDSIADKYFNEIESPFSSETNHEIFKKIGKGKSVIDLGTGIGNLIPFLSQNFKNVVAVDFSEGMLNKAKEKNKDNVKFYIRNLNNLKGFYEKFDVAIAINSIIMPSLIDINKTFNEIYKVLKKGGKFIGVFPSLDSDIYRAMLTFETELNETKSEAKAKKNTKYIMCNDNYDWIFGIYNNKGRQKHYFKEELSHRLKNFKKIKIEKLHYEENNWDWLVTAEK
tara:strand:- start:517 stop:1200 length:684 start_codon:yes stop_codon:yes gene_type:complete